MRKPDVVIGNDYMRRWHLLPRNKWVNIYLHNIRHSDDDRALHDHPYLNVSIVLRGEYVEVTPKGVFWRRAGSIVFRRSVALHRIVLPYLDESAWSLFITGPRIRTWGFQCPQGWRPWFEFVDTKDSTKIGRGCAD